MIGRYVISKAGHDEGRVYVVVACEQDYLYLADGRLKKADAPKKKKKKHVQITNSSADRELTEALERKDAHLDDRIKYAVKQYSMQIHKLEGTYVKK